MVDKVVDEPANEPEPVKAAAVKPDVREFDPVLFLQLSEQWADQFNLRSMVLMTPDTEVLFDTLGNTKLTQMAQKLAKAAPASGNLFVRIAAGTSLQVLPVSTGLGDLTLGLLVSTALSSDQVARLAEQVRLSL